MMSDLTPLQVAAALAEIAYRRAPEDQALNLVDIPGAEEFPLSTPEGLTLDGGYYYHDATGFVGRVVQAADGTIYVVLRGTVIGVRVDFRRRRDRL
jgi:hypothetical protein